MSLRTLALLAGRSLANRRTATTLAVLTIALSVALLFGVEQIRRGARAGFEGAISRTDLVVGPRAGPAQLLLYTVFHVGAPVNNIAFETFEAIAADPDVEWTIPLSLGDSHRGARVVATSADFYVHFRFRGDQALEFAEGRAPEGVFEAAIGSQAASRLGYAVGDEIAITHGLSAAGFYDHADKPFVVVGVLERTATPVDHTVIVTLEGMEAIHVDWTEGAPPVPGQEVPAAAIRPEDMQPDEITGFLVGLRSRALTLAAQRRINNYSGEPLTAVIPGAVLSDLWRTIGQAETALSLVSAMVVAVGLLGLSMSLYATLSERRREMAILRSLGARPRDVLALLVAEAAALTAMGAAVGVVAAYVLVAVARPAIEARFGLWLPIQAPSQLELAYLAGVMVAGLLVGLLPGLRAYRSTLADGLVVRQ